MALEDMPRRSRPLVVTTVSAHGGAGGAGGTFVGELDPYQQQRAVANFAQLEQIAPDIGQSPDATFAARQLVAQAIADYQAACDRAKRADARVATVERQNRAELDKLAQVAREADRELTAARLVVSRLQGELEHARAELAKLQPRITRELFSPLFRDARQKRIEYEPTRLWLVTSIAFVLAGLVVCVL